MCKGCFLDRLIGLSEKEATEICETYWYDVRILRRNGVPTVATRDHRLDRINFYIEDDKVIEVFIG